MSVNRLNSELARLRHFRTRSEPDLSVQAPLRDICRDLARRSRSQSGIAAAWELVAPPHLATSCEVIRLSRGTLTMRAANASARYQLDSFLRSGGENELAKRAGVTIRRVKFL